MEERRLVGDLDRLHHYYRGYNRMDSQNPQGRKLDRDAAGCLGFLRGKELLLMLMNYSDRSILLSHQLGNEKHPYYPKKYKTFNISKE